MPRRDRERLADMLQAAQRAISLLEDRTRNDLEDDDTLALSLARLLEIVGEAANHISKETRTDLPSIPWPDVVGMRHKLIHAYFDVDHDVVWQTVKEDLPPVVDVLESRLAEGDE